MSDPKKKPSGAWRGWFAGFLIGAVLTGGILHFGDLRNFARLAGRAKPLWLIGALLLQLSTYVSLAAGWQAVLRESGNPMRLPPLLRIAITKLFADQAIPSAGMGGNVILGRIDIQDSQMG